MLALQSVIATIGLVAIVSHLVPMDPSVGAVITLVGLAVGVDYSLFYLKREREERAAGRSESAALQAAAATSGRSVLISGATVMIAMAGMLFSGDKTFESFGVATMIVVAVAMIGSLTVLPAVLSDRTAPAARRAEPGVVGAAHPGAAASGGGRSRGGGADGGAGRPDAPAPHGPVRDAGAAAQRTDGRDARPHPGRLPG